MAKKAKSKVKAALVTGAGSGIGRATAELLMSKGWNVAFLDISEDALADVKAQHGKSKHARFHAVDVTNEKAVEAAVADTAKAFGGLTGVVNSAGISALKHVFDQPVDHFRKMLDVNVVGTFIVGRAAARIMMDQGGGSIVNIASIAGYIPLKTLAPYCTSKAAVIQLTKVMALELARDNVRVNALAPGYFSTELNEEFLKGPAGQKLLSKVPFERAGRMDELDGPLLLLASDAGSFMTGSIVAVDGGILLSAG